MKQKINANIYRWLVYVLILTPNIFASIVGVESFPYTSAPMFGHYVGEQTQLYLLKFEASSGEEHFDLDPFYGRPEPYFIRHFFSKVYGSPGHISAFNGRLSESPQKFQSRMNTFFSDFANQLLERHNLEFDKIYLKAIRVDKERTPLAKTVVLGFYDTETKQYNLLDERDK